jgi:hypothetical protein
MPPRNRRSAELSGIETARRQRRSTVRQLLKARKLTISMLQEKGLSPVPRLILLVRLQIVENNLSDNVDVS